MDRASHRELAESRFKGLWFHAMALDRGAPPRVAWLALLVACAPGGESRFTSSRAGSPSSTLHAPPTAARHRPARRGRRDVPARRGWSAGGRASRDAQRRLDRCGGRYLGDRRARQRPALRGVRRRRQARRRVRHARRRRRRACPSRSRRGPTPARRRARTQHRRTRDRRRCRSRRAPRIRSAARRPTGAASRSARSRIPTSPVDAVVARRWRVRGRRSARRRHRWRRQAESFPLAGLLDGIRGPNAEWTASPNAAPDCTPQFQLYDVHLAAEPEAGKPSIRRRRSSSTCSASSISTAMAATSSCSRCGSRPCAASSCIRRPPARSASSSPARRRRFRRSDRGTVVVRRQRSWRSTPTRASRTYTRTSSIYLVRVGSSDDSRWHVAGRVRCACVSLPSRCWWLPRATTTVRI